MLKKWRGMPKGYASALLAKSIHFGNVQKTD
jgi:hypothetical protein